MNAPHLESRRALIVTRAIALKIVQTSSPLLGLMGVSRGEIAQEARQLKCFSSTQAPQVQNVSFEDEDSATETSSLAMIRASETEDETPSESLLSRSEKKRVAYEVDGLRWKNGKARNLWLIVS